MEPIPDTPQALWVLVTYIIVRDAIIPLALKMFPARQLQNAEKERRVHELEDREIAAIEAISETLIKLNDRQVSAEASQAVILSNQAEHSKALAILVDRVSRETTRRKAVK